MADGAIALRSSQIFGAAAGTGTRPGAVNNEEPDSGSTPPPSEGRKYEVGGSLRNAGSAIFHGVKGTTQTTTVLFGGAGAGLLSSLTMRVVKEPQIGAQAVQFSVRTAARSVPASVGAIAGALASQGFEAAGIVPKYKEGDSVDPWDQRGVEFGRAAAAGATVAALSLPLYLAKPDIFEPGPGSGAVNRLKSAMDMSIPAELVSTKKFMGFHAPTGKFLGEWAAKAGVFLVLPAMASAWMNHDKFDASNGKLIPPDGSLF